MNRWVVLIWLMASHLLIASPRADTWSWIGIMAHQVGLKKVGHTCLWRAHRADPHQVRHRYNLGLSYRHRHHTQRAQQTFEFLASRPLSPPMRQQTWQQLGALAHHQGHHHAAFHWYRLMVSHSPFPVQTPHYLSQVYTHLTPAISPPHDQWQWHAILTQYEQALPPSPPTYPAARKVPLDW